MKYAALLLCMLTLAGCKRGRVADEQGIDALAAMTYPAEAPAGQAIDIVLRRDGSVIYLSNRTARRYDNVPLWLNQQYVSVLDAIEIGSNNRYSLRSFVNAHRESFPVAGFLAPDRADPIVSAELLLPDAEGQLVRHPITVRYKPRSY